MEARTLNVDAEKIDELDEWANADLYQHSDEYAVPDELDIDADTYDTFALAEPRGESGADQPYVVYPLKDDGSLYDDVTWELLRDYEVGKQAGLDV
jgi:hypothetical protein